HLGGTRQRRPRGRLGNDQFAQHGGNCGLVSPEAVTDGLARCPAQGNPWASPCHGGCAMTLPPSLKAPGFVTRPYWWGEAEPPQRDNALPAHSAVAIVGGGYAGLSAALTLRRLG